MILILKGADFSANNIGKIDVSSVLSERTKAIVARFRRNISDYTKFALQELIDWLDSEGILSNMDGLYLPCLAGSVEETFINVAKSPFNADVVPSSSVFELRCNGIRTKVTGGSSAKDQIILTSTAPVNDMHLLWFNMEEYSGVAQDVIYPFGGSNNYSFSYGSEGYIAGSPQSTLGGYNLNSLGGGRNNNSAALSANKSLKGINHKNLGASAGLVIYNPQKKVTNYKNPIDYNSLTDIINSFNIAGANNGSMRVPHGLVSVGRGLTDEQVFRYNDLSNRLIETI